MALVGSRKVAEALLEDRYPEGVERLDGGGCRSVFIDQQTKVVYKLDEEGYRVLGYDNEREFRNARYLAKSTGWWREHVAIPPVSGYRFNDRLVVAMPFIEGTIGWTARHSIPKIKRDALAATGFADMHGGNYIVANDGMIWIIDLGSPRSPRAPSDYAYDGPDPRIMMGV